MNKLLTPACFDRLEYRPNHSAWCDYAPVAFWLVDALRPRCFVELGVHYGLSYFAFCQQIKKLGVECYALAVDNWYGDDHTGFYGLDPNEDVLGAVKAENRRYESFSALLQGPFEWAATQIPDGSVDLLHIDGFHTYEAVSSDYRAFEKKLSDEAVVLFHDTNTEHIVDLTTGLKVEDFGIHRFFEETRAGCASFEFFHGCGMGLVAPNSPPSAFARLAGLSQQGSHWLREMYHNLGNNLLESDGEYSDITVTEVLSAFEETIRRCGDA